MRCSDQNYNVYGAFINAPFSGISTFLLTKNALLEKGPKNSGMGRPPPPLFGQCPKENVFFSMDLFPYLGSFIMPRCL